METLINFVVIALVIWWSLEAGFKILNIVLDFKKKRIERKIRKQSLENFNNSVKKNKAEMKIHLKIVETIVSDFLLTNEEQSVKEDVVNQFQEYLGLYEKIKTSQKVIEAETVRFSQLYVNYNDIIHSKKLVEQKANEANDRLYEFNNLN